MPHEISLAQAADMVKRTANPLAAVICYTHLPHKLLCQLKDHERRTRELAAQIDRYERRTRNVHPDFT